MKDDTKYGNYNLKDIEEVVNEVFKNYKDPTEGMTLEQKKKFHEAMKKAAEKWANNIIKEEKIYFNDEWNRKSDI